jgi:hypothetical protein
MEIKFDALDFRIIAHVKFGFLIKALLNSLNICLKGVTNIRLPVYCIKDRSTSYIILSGSQTYASGTDGHAGGLFWERGDLNPV